eukprot:1117679-Lingulodinium_polyedra.AAC.1
MPIGPDPRAFGERKRVEACLHIFVATRPPHRKCKFGPAVRLFHEGISNLYDGSSKGVLRNMFHVE